MTNKTYNLPILDTDETYLHLVIDDNFYRIRGENCSPKLTRASLEQRKRMEPAPSGYGIHWPELDEDLAITPLLEYAEKVHMELVG